MLCTDKFTCQNRQQEVGEASFSKKTFIKELQLMLKNIIDHYNNHFNKKFNISSHLSVLS